MKSLVIYYSRAGENYMENGIENIVKGNTQLLAEQIEKLTGADLFKVEEVYPYSSNYYECCDEAKKDLQNNVKAELKNYLSSIDEYDQIIICSPIWWNHIPMPLYAQLEKLDFINKNVKFIITHEGSGIGGCKDDINKLCKGAQIDEGSAIRGCKVMNSLEQLKNYLNK